MAAEAAPDIERVSWDDLEAMSVDLAQQVEADPRRFTRLLVLQRGGAFTGNVMAYYLGLNATQILSASVTSYEEGSMEGDEELLIGQFPRREDVEGQTVLTVDDVCDSGRTLERVNQEVLWLGAEAVASAVPHFKRNASKTGYVPDFYARITDKSKWLEYPWDRLKIKMARTLIAAA